MKQESCVQTTLYFLFTAGGVLLSYTLYAYFQEWMYTISELSNYGVFLTMMEFGLRSCLCWVQFYTQQKCRSRPLQANAPQKCYLLVGLLSAATMGFSNCALSYLNYPTQMIFKSCKLIPVMIGGVLIQSKRYTILDYLSVSLMTIGLIWFTSVDKKLNSHFSIFGVILVCSALCVDALLGNFQEKILKDYRISQAELMTFSYSFGTLLLLIVSATDGSVVEAYGVMVNSMPLSLYLIISLTLCGYIGINLIFLLIRKHGALVSVTVTTLRKAISTVISFITFSKPFSIDYFFSGMVILTGVTLNICSRNRKQCGSCLWTLFSKTFLVVTNKCVKFKSEDEFSQSDRRIVMNL